MYCPNCGQQAPDNSPFCPNCGQPLTPGEQMKAAATNAFNAAEQEIGSAVQEVQQSFNGYQNQQGYGNQGGYQQQGYQQQGYGNPAPNGGVPPYSGERLKDDRGLLSYILLTLVTCGIYSYYFLYKMAHDVNIACEGDGENTNGLVAFILLSFITCGIYAWFWYYKLGNRLASNAPRYGMTFQENGTTVIMWFLFGSMLCGIGPFVATNILIKNSNKICGAYNRAHGM